MAINPSLSFSSGGGDVPFEVEMAPGQDIDLEAVSVLWDGSGASGTFLACCSIYSQNGVLISRTFPSQQFAAGDSGEVTYAVPLGDAGAAASGGCPGGLTLPSFWEVDCDTGVVVGHTVDAGTDYNLTMLGGTESSGVSQHGYDCQYTGGDLVDQVAYACTMTEAATGTARMLRGRIVGNKDAGSALFGLDLNIQTANPAYMNLSLQGPRVQSQTIGYGVKADASINTGSGGLMFGGLMTSKVIDAVGGDPATAFSTAVGAGATGGNTSVIIGVDASALKLAGKTPFDIIGGRFNPCIDLIVPAAEPPTPPGTPSSDPNKTARLYVWEVGGVMKLRVNMNGTVTTLASE